jgi:hypothetical protein
MARVQVQTGSNLTVRLGVCAERIDDAAPTDPGRKYGIEACESAGNAANWSVFSANGSLRGSQDVGASWPVAAGAIHAYKLIFLPNSKVEYYRNGTYQGQRTDTVPVGGNVLNHSRSLGVGLKTNTTQTRQLYLSGLALVGRVNDASWS